MTLVDCLPPMIMSFHKPWPEVGVNHQGNGIYEVAASNFEVALQVPLIISDSRLPNAARTNSIAELVDLYPTLCELTAGESPTHLQGSSLVSALKSPATIFKNSALARWKKGETLIVDQLFYTEWKRKNKVVSKMLYNHETDPDETINLANDPAYLSIVKALSQQLTI